jgi:hypothetical protein
MKTILMTFALSFAAAGLPAASVTPVEVDAAAIECLYNPACTNLVDESSSPITLPGATGSGFLQTRIIRGEVGAPAAGLFGYEYRIDLSGMSLGTNAQPCFTNALQCVTNRIEIVTNVVVCRTNGVANSNQLTCVTNRLPATNIMVCVTNSLPGTNFQHCFTNAVGAVDCFTNDFPATNYVVCFTNHVPGRKIVSCQTNQVPGGFVVTWDDYSQGVGGATGDTSEWAVKAQVFAADGVTPFPNPLAPKPPMWSS